MATCSKCGRCCRGLCDRSRKPLSAWGRLKRQVGTSWAAFLFYLGLAVSRFLAFLSPPLKLIGRLLQRFAKALRDTLVPFLRRLAKAFVSGMRCVGNCCRSLQRSVVAPAGKRLTAAWRFFRQRLWNPLWSAVCSACRCLKRSISTASGKTWKLVLKIRAPFTKATQLVRRIATSARTALRSGASKLWKATEPTRKAVRRCVAACGRARAAVGRWATRFGTAIHRRTVAPVSRALKAVRQWAAQRSSALWRAIANRFKEAKVRIARPCRWIWNATKKGGKAVRDGIARTTAAPRRVLGRFATAVRKRLGLWSGKLASRTRSVRQALASAGRRIARLCRSAVWDNRGARFVRKLISSAVATLRHKIIRPICGFFIAPSAPQLSVDGFALVGDTTVYLGSSGFNVMFERSLRTPEDSDIHEAPPSLGAFPLFRASDYPAERLPPDWLEEQKRLGNPEVVFLVMRSREALWLSFETEGMRQPCAIRLTVGGVNVATGKPESEPNADSRQDYLVCPEQKWLDGICFPSADGSGGTVRQFVAVPRGGGYSAGEQLQPTVSDATGGFFFRVFPRAEGVPLHCEQELPNGVIASLQLWDTAGQERFQSMGVSFYRGSEIAVLVFDVANRSSFDHLEQWLTEIEIQTSNSLSGILVLGNKCDLERQEVTRQELLDWARLRCRHNYRYHAEFVSAKTAHKVEQAFSRAVRLWRGRHVAGAKRVLIKAILIGDSGVGKTSLLQRYTSNRFSSSYRATIGCDFATREVLVESDSSHAPPTATSICRSVDVAECKASANFSPGLNLFRAKKRQMAPAAQLQQKLATELSMGCGGRLSQNIAGDPYYSGRNGWRFDGPCAKLLVKVVTPALFRRITGKQPPVARLAMRAHDDYRKTTQPAFSGAETGPNEEDEEDEEEDYGQDPKKDNKRVRTVGQMDRRATARALRNGLLLPYELVDHIFGFVGDPGSAQGGDDQRSSQIYVRTVFGNFAR